MIASKLKTVQKEDQNSQDVLSVWRTRIFSTIFSSAIVIAVLPYFSNMKIAISSGQLFSACVYSAAYIVAIFVIFSKFLPYKIRISIGLFLFYIVGVTSLITLGIYGSGRLWLVTFAVLATLLLGLKAGFIALALNLATLFLWSWAVVKNFSGLSAELSNQPIQWHALNLSFFFMNAVITVSLGVLVSVLEKKIRKEQSLSNELKITNKRLSEDIAARIAVEQNLRKSEKRYKTLTQNLQVGIFRYSGGNENRFLEANPALLKMFGFASRDEIEDLDITDFFIDQLEKNKFQQKISRYGYVKNEKLGMKTRNGTPIVCDISLVAIKDEGGNILYYDGVIEDITERIHLEKRLQQAQKMEAVGTLAGGVAHDLNNILSGIVSYPELILMDLPEKSPLRKPIKTIHDSGQRAAAIVQDLLTLARRGVSISEIVNLNDITSEYLLSPEFDKLKIFNPLVKIQTHLDPSLLNIMGSPVHLSKTIMNLVSNAVEAMPDGGKILIRTENIYIDRPICGYDEIEEGDYVVLTVSDTGIGIAEEEIGKIFEPFYTKKVMGRSGTGLGMAVVWGTVKDHNGYINVESTFGNGTTFKVYFPVTRKQKVEEQHPNRMIDYKGNGESILVVDDIKDQREIASKILSRLGYSVKTVTSGEEAAKLLEKQKVDLIVLDMIMPPGIDGLETYKRIINFHPDQKAIIASGFSETERVKEAQQLGVGGYVKKPYTIEKIGLAVKAELKKDKQAA
jgi:two-component system cell cycle sensor histidine kinase/response regulator CckA